MGGSADVENLAVRKRDAFQPLPELIGSALTLSEKVRALVVRCDSVDHVPVDLDWRLAEVGTLIAGADSRPLPLEASADGSASGADKTPVATSLIARRQLDDGSVWAVIGDLHGDYPALESLLRSLFETGMKDFVAEHIHVAVLGDLLDRGAKDFQVLHLVLCLRLLLGPRFLLLRGNHEELAIDDDGRLMSLVAENKSTHGLFARRYREAIDAELSKALVSFVEGLPHLAILEGARGKVGLVHGGIPPAFVFKRFSTLDEMMSMENARRAFLWGRPFPFLESTIEPRPSRPYEFKRFYREDADDFRETHELEFLVRGHDAVEPGYDSRWDGTLLTVFSSGAGARSALAGIGAYGDTVCLPRYLLLETNRLFSGEKRIEVDREVAAGIGIREIFSRDVVMLLSGSGPSDFGHDGVLESTARAIQEELRPVFDVPFHLLARPGYSEEVDTEIDLLEPVAGSFDGRLDDVRLGRYAYVLDSLRGRLRFCRWYPPGAEERGAQPPGIVAFSAYPPDAAGIAQCASLIAGNLE